MTLLQFSVLNKEQQVNLIKKQGAVLCVRNEVGIDVVLYQLYSFYAEVFFETANSDKLRIKCFDDTRALDVYLNEISLSDLQHLL